MRLFLRPLPPGSLAHAGTVTLAMEGGRRQLCAFVGDGDEVPGDISFEFDEGRDHFSGELVGIEGARGYFEEVRDMAPSGDGGWMNGEGTLPPVTKPLAEGEWPTGHPMPVQTDDGTCPADYPAHEQVIEARVAPEVLYPERPNLAEAQDARRALDWHASQDPGMQEQIRSLGEENARLAAEVEALRELVPVTRASRKQRSTAAELRLSTVTRTYEEQAKNLRRRLAEVDAENRDLRTANMHLQNTSAVESFLKRLAVASDNRVFAIIASLARRGALLDEVVELVEALVPKGETRITIPADRNADSSSDDGYPD